MTDGTTDIISTIQNPHVTNWTLKNIHPVEYEFFTLHQWQSPQSQTQTMQEDVYICYEAFINDIPNYWNIQTTCDDSERDVFIFEA